MNTVWDIIYPEFHDWTICFTVKMQREALSTQNIFNVHLYQIILYCTILKVCGLHNYLNIE